MGSPDKVRAIPLFKSQKVRKSECTSPKVLVKMSEKRPERPDSVTFFKFEIELFESKFRIVANASKDWTVVTDHTHVHGQTESLRLNLTFTYNPKLKSTCPQAEGQTHGYAYRARTFRTLIWFRTFGLSDAGFDLRDQKSELSPTDPAIQI
jgi:hypothetical protein